MSNDMPDFSTVANPGSPVLIQTVSALAGATTTVDLTVPAGTQAIGYLIRADAGNLLPQSVSITGDQTKFPYLNVVPTSIAASEVNAVLFGTDTTVTVVMQANASGPSAIDVVSWTTPTAMVPQRSHTAPLEVALFRPDGLQVGYDNTSIANLGVSSRFANPALWQAANLKPIRVSLPLTAGAANRQQLLAGVGGQVIRLFGAALAFDTNPGGGAVSLCDGDPNAGGTRVVDFNLSVLAPPPYRGGSDPLTSGNALYIMTDVNVTVRGAISVSQG